METAQTERERDEICENLIRKFSQNPAFVRLSAKQEIRIRLIDLQSMSEGNQTIPLLPQFRTKIHDSTYRLPE